MVWYCGIGARRRSRDGTRQPLRVERIWSPRFRFGPRTLLSSTLVCYLYLRNTPFLYFWQPQATETEERKKAREEKVAKESLIREEIKEIVNVFYCEVISRALQRPQMHRTVRAAFNCCGIFFPIRRPEGGSPHFRCVTSSTQTTRNSRWPIASKFCSSHPSNV